MSDKIINVKSRYSRGLGKGKHMSIAKAALVVWNKHKPNGGFNYGQLDYIEEIINVAGCKHIGAHGPFAVTQRLSKSPYWDSLIIYDYYAGISNGRAAVYTPSDKGLQWIKQQNL